MKSFAEQSIAWLVITSIVAVVTSYLTYKFIKHQEIIDTVKEQVRADILREIHRSNLETEKSKTDRIRRESLKWANPILGSVKDLNFRLNNILESEGYLALSTNYQAQINPNWSVTYDYYIGSAEGHEYPNLQVGDEVDPRLSFCVNSKSINRCFF